MIIVSKHDRGSKDLQSNNAIVGDGGGQVHSEKILIDPKLLLAVNHFE